VLHGSHFAIVWTLAALLSAGASIVALSLPETRPEHEARSAGSDVILHRAAIRPGIVLTASQFGYSALSAFMALFALQLGLHGSRFVFLLYALTILAIRAVGARIPDVLGPARTATLSLCVSMCGLVVIGLAHGAPVLYAGTVVFACGQALAFPALMSLAIGAAPASERGAVIGTFTAFFDVSYALGPISLGAVAVFFDYRGAFFGAAVVHVAGLVILLSQRRSSR
jgi:MFS family permease